MLVEAAWSVSARFWACGSRKLRRATEVELTDHLGYEHGEHHRRAGPGTITRRTSGGKARTATPFQS
jgi:hypothetical protein